MRVLKFGGSSIATAGAIQRVVQIIRDQPEATVVVLSAMGDTTDRLEEAGAAAAEGREHDSHQLLRTVTAIHRTTVAALELPAQLDDEVHIHLESIARTVDRLLSGIVMLSDLSGPVRARLLACGELMSTRIVTAALAAAGVPGRWFDSRELIVTTPGDPLDSEPDEPGTRDACLQTLIPALARGVVPVIQGFIGRSPDGRAVLLGRGGSDCTASVVGAALAADRIDIWTDVDGILTADPTLVPEATLVAEMTFAEAAELAFFGARVLHPKTLEPAVRAGVPIRVRNTRRPHEAGTLISNDATTPGAIKSIAYKENITLIRLSSARMFRSTSFLAAVFDRFERAGVTADAIATTEVSAAIAVCQPPPLDHLLDALATLGSVSTVSRQSLVCIVGDGLRSQRGMVARVFDDLSEIPISMVSEGGSELALAFVVGDADLPAVIRRLHTRFFADRGPGSCSQPFGGVARERMRA